MPRCPACREWIRGEREQIGARCPHCRLPLYERPELFKRRPARADNQCSVHPTNPAVSACPRCGNFQCDLCRTRWRDRWLCVACVNRALESADVRPEEQRAHSWEAMLSLVFGISAWVLLVGGVLLAAAAVAGGGDVFLIGLAGLLILGTALPSVVGTGLGAAALYTRGNHMILATVGLLLSGVHTGALLGLLSFSMWNAIA